MAGLLDTIEASRTVPDAGAVRVPGGGSQRRIAEGRARGWIDVAAPIYEALRA
ncbi:hypothetical protein [Neoroseomonas lacus]|uniref:Uncharacterized protein n=1 Tax=Neoroseomonas lacus TaxID=287609 RepID=A0A917KTK2_9PROT|nr:hypothetical protein [Neoroseomonas lacus]GGJ23988.1 hypothetical protein GCM10011320_34100 [Neoroseomonas lacus]